MRIAHRQTRVGSSSGPGRVHAGGRTGFSLVEILIAIGVIGVLATIGVLGFQSLQTSTNKKQCYLILATGESLVKELAASGSFARLEGPPDIVPPPVFVDPVGPTQATLAAETYGDVNIGKPGRNELLAAPATTAPPAGAEKIMDRVMKLLLSVPANKARVTGLSRESIVPPPPGLTTTYYYSPLADPWENPILFVPSGGLTGVTTDGGSGLTVKSPDNRPFWVSAGPDGNFITGNDNLYSFDK